MPEKQKFIPEQGTQLKRSALQKGMVAADQKLTRTSNPFNKESHSRDHQLWNRGYDDVREIQSGTTGLQYGKGRKIIRITGMLEYAKALSP